MPANLSPEYKQAEAEYRKAREPKKKLDCLREMLRAIPKHKGTEHLQADIKTKIKQLTEELAGPKKGGARGGPPQAVRAEGAAQIPLIGAANVGKSSLLAKLTGSKTEIGPYPYTTKYPIPGMLAFEDIQFQLVDLPPLSKELIEPWYANALQTADAALLVIDLSNPECLDNIRFIMETLDKKRVTLQHRWPFSAQTTVAEKTATASPPKPISPKTDNDEPDPFRLHLQPDPNDAKTLVELLGTDFIAIPVSAENKIGLDKIGPLLFSGLGIVRVYTKIPGKKTDTGPPYTLRRGSKIQDLAQLVHKDLAASIKFAKLWGSGLFQGQQVGPEHELADKDIVELHN